MQPVSVIISGSFWDSQIYSGELNLFGAEGSFHRINWSDLVDELASERPEIQTALRVAFSDSDLFYTQKVRKILRDPDIESIIKRQLTNLSSLSVEADAQRWQKHWRVCDSPFDFLPIDSDIYYHYVLAAGDEGLFSSFRSTGTSKSLNKGAQKHHDGKLLQVKASHHSTAVAAAAGDDGLLEFSFKSQSVQLLESQRTLARRPCSACDWAFQSIFAWDATSAYLANFRKERDPRSNKIARILDAVIGEEEFFLAPVATDASYVWGSQEKIFRVSNSGGLDVVNYVPPAERKDTESQATKPRPSLFKTLGSAKIRIDPELIVATGTAPFGSIIELPDRLIVLRSDGERNEFHGEPLHWRVFPRSDHYSNQLHIVYEDHIQIVSFVHDYFVEQNSKLTGFARGSNDYIVQPRRTDA